MKRYLFHLVNNPTMSDVTVLANSEEEAQHKLLSAVLDGQSITSEGNFYLVHKEKI